MEDLKKIQLNVFLDGLIDIIDKMDFDKKVETINEVRCKLHGISPFKDEPVDFVRWVSNNDVIANDYNPNKVAPPEMQLLEVSIINDGYTQPIVTFPREDVIEVVDGFHRSRVGKESLIVSQRVKGYLPIVSIRKEQQDKKERIASTIRHNRARGKHQVSAMSEIVIELKNRNWSNKRISTQLGMDEDEILRLCQISGLEGMFQDKDFNQAWVSEGFSDEDFQAIDDDVSDQMDLIRIPNENDEERIFHTFDKWEAVDYGFYDQNHKTLTKVQCEHKYKILLSDTKEFSRVLEKVLSEWKYSCEHNLTNKSMNRIAWIGQACVSYKYNVPSRFSSGWQLLTEKEQEEANKVAFHYLNKWLIDNGLNEITLEEAMQTQRQVELY
jgi:ParB-like chromosome segregation protein Spo0J